MKRWDAWKPAAAARTHLLLAGSLWTGIGAGLAIAGTRWLLQADRSTSAALIPAGIALGLLKGKLALERTAKRSSSRILQRGDGKCLGGFLSWRTWLFVLAMMSVGAALRRSALPRPALGVVYLAVGTGLVWASRLFWLARRLRD